MALDVKAGHRPFKRVFVIQYFRTLIVSYSLNIRKMARPILRCNPDMVVGMPVARAILFRNPEMPNALFHENENPKVLRLLMG